MGTSLPSDPKGFGSDGSYGPMLMGVGPHGLHFINMRLGWALYYLLCPSSSCPLSSLSVLLRRHLRFRFRYRRPSPESPERGRTEAEANNRRGREGLIRRWRRLVPPGTWEPQVLIPKQILDARNALLGCIHGIGVPRWKEKNEKGDYKLGVAFLVGFARPIPPLV